MDGVSGDRRRYCGESVGVIVWILEINSRVGSDGDGNKWGMEPHLVGIRTVEIE